MRTKPRRRTTRIGPVRVNRVGLTRVTSVTMRLLWRDLVIWEARR